MKVYIKKGKDNEIISHNCYAAYDGFKQMGWEIVYYKEISEVQDNMPEDIIVGGIGDVHVTLKKFNLEIPEICYPEELQRFYGRKIWKSTLYNIANNPDKWCIFIKPIYDVKRFTGVLVTGTKDLIDCNGNLGDTDVWCSEPVNFLAEWRCFVRYNKILDIKLYKGDWRQHFDYKVVEEAVKSYICVPNGYGIDFGVTDTGKTIVVEVNEGYSLGCYGLSNISYAKLLSARWADLTKTEDQCDF